MCISRSCEVRFVCRSAHIAAQRHLVTVALLLSFSIYCLAPAFEHYRQVYIVHSGLQDESLQVTISKLP